MTQNPLNTVESILKHPGCSQPKGELRLTLIELTRKGMDIPDTTDRFDRMIIIKRCHQAYPTIPMSILFNAAGIKPGHYYNTMTARTKDVKSNSEHRYEVSMALLDIRQQYGGDLSTAFFIRKLNGMGIRAGRPLVDRLKTELGIKDTDGNEYSD